MGGGTARAGCRWPGGWDSAWRPLRLSCDGGKGSRADWPVVVRPQATAEWIVLDRVSLSLSPAGQWHAAEEPVPIRGGCLTLTAHPGLHAPGGSSFFIPTRPRHLFGTERQGTIFFISARV